MNSKSKLILGFLLLAITFNVSFAQRSASPKRLSFREYGKMSGNHGTFAADVGIGPKPYSGINFQAGVSFLFGRANLKGAARLRSPRYSFPKQFLRAAIFHSYSQLYGVDHRAEGIDLMLGYTIFNFKDYFYANVVAGGTYTTNRFSGDQTAFDDPRFNSLNKAKPGGVAGFELNMFFSKTSRTSLVLGFTQRFYEASNPQEDNRWYSTISVRHNFVKLRPINGIKSK